MIRHMLALGTLGDITSFEFSEGLPRSVGLRLRAAISASGRHRAAC